MARFRHLIRDESGQALAVVLVCLALGSLIIVPSVAYAATVVHGVSSKESSLRGLYAADAGIEDVLWSLKQGTQPHTGLAENINGMQVAMNTVTQGTYTLVAGDWVMPGGSHSEDLEISTSMVWNAGANAYQYTITCTWSGSGNCNLIGVGARLPVGYNYKALSAASFGGNLSTAEPGDQLDGLGAHMLGWTFPQTSITTRTQTFYATGSGNLQGDYAWAEATRSDVGSVGELTGAFYVVTATATRPQDGVITGKVEANVMQSGSSLLVTSYRILK